VEENSNRTPENNGEASAEKGEAGSRSAAEKQTPAGMDATMPAADSTQASIEATQASQPPASERPLNDTMAVPSPPQVPRPAAAAAAPPKKEVPAGTKPAARVAAGAAKAGGTPTSTVARGVPKAAAKPAVGAVVESTPDQPVNKMRRRIVWASVAGFLATSFLMFVRFFLPRAIFEPSTVFRIGFPSDYGIGVDTKWQQQHRIWVDKTSDKLFVIYARCTHLGCTPDWKASENKFKCPCHGSGYDSEGINFEGPAPRPMDRAHVELDAEGQIVVDTNRLYKWPKGEKNEFVEEGSYISL
jgi:cytochrome b6-f complex iron-sulfur subunit